MYTGRQNLCISENVKKKINRTDHSTSAGITLNCSVDEKMPFYIQKDISLNIME